VIPASSDGNKKDENGERFPNYFEQQGKTRQWASHARAMWKWSIREMTVDMWSSNIQVLNQRWNIWSAGTAPVKADYHLLEWILCMDFAPGTKQAKQCTRFATANEKLAPSYGRLKLNRDKNHNVYKRGETAREIRSTKL
jgi:hypothetical protein